MTLHPLRNPLVAGISLLLSVSCAQGPDATKQAALERADEYLSQGKPNEAIIELKNALQIDKDFGPALHALGRAYATKASYRDALSELSRAQTLAPDSVAIAVDLGRVLVEVGFWKGAAAQADRILDREPQNVQGLYIRAAALLGQGRVEEALAVAQTAPKGGADLDGVRAAALLRLGKMEQAEHVYRAILAATPDDAVAVRGLGNISLARRNNEEAIALYRRAKVMAPLNPRVRLGLATALARSGRVRQAVQELEDVEPQARSADILMALGDYYLQAGRPAEAIALLSPVVGRSPQFVPARYLLASAYLATGRVEESLRELEELNREVPNDPAIQFRLASAYLRGGRVREALVRLDSIAEPLQSSPEYHLERGRALLLLGRENHAMAAAKTAQRLAPRAPEPYLLLGQIRAEQGDRKAARDLFAQAAALDESYAPAHLALGWLHAAERDTQAALREFQAAVEADPRSLAAARAKVVALVRWKGIGEAIEFVQSTSNVDPRNPAFHVLLAGLYQADRRWENAATAYRKALELDPRMVEARLGLALLALAQSREDEAISHLQAIVKDRPTQPTAVLLLVSVYDRLGRLDRAVPVLESAANAPPLETQWQVALGEVYLRNERYEDAIARMSQVLARSSDVVAARLIRGRAHLEARNLAAAVKDLSEVARLNPKLAAAHYYLATAYVALGQTQEARAAYREALRLNPQLEPAKSELAIISGEEPDKAAQLQRIESLKAALKIDPKNVPIREELARTLLMNRAVSQARGELQEILQLAPAHPTANVLMARVLLGEGRVDTAADHLRTVLRSNPSHLEANVLLARDLQTRGRREEAVRHLEAALRVNPRLDDVKLQLGTLYLQTGRLTQALPLVREVEQNAPKSPAGPLLAGNILLAQHNPKLASEAFSASLRLKPDLAEGHRGLGQAHQALGHIDAAVKSYRRAIALNGNDVISLNNLAWILAENRRGLEEALRLVSRAAELAPGHADVLDTLGWIHYRRAAYTDAEQALARGLERAPDNGLIRYHLGLVYMRLGKKGEAVSSLRRAAQLDPRLAEKERISDLILEIDG